MIYAAIFLIIILVSMLVNAIRSFNFWHGRAIENNENYHRMLKEKGAVQVNYWTEQFRNQALSLQIKQLTEVAGVLIQDNYRLECEKIVLEKAIRSTQKQAIS